MIFYAVSVSSLPLIDSQQLSKRGGGSTKPEVSLISSKGPGLKSQPEVKIRTSFCITFEFDENQQPQRQDKLMCLFSYVYKHYTG